MLKTYQTKKNFIIVIMIKLENNHKYALKRIYYNDIGQCQIINKGGHLWLVIEE